MLLIMNVKQYADFQLAMILKDKGFTEGCSLVYINHYRVKDEIYEKYPGLSDDGYRELTVEWGGELAEEEVYANYVEPAKLWGRNTPEFFEDMPYMLCTMPTLDAVRDWLRIEYGIHVVIVPQAHYYRATVIPSGKDGLVDAAAGVTVLNPAFGPVDNRSTRFDGWYDALNEALKMALNYIDVNKL